MSLLKRMLPDSVVLHMYARAGSEFEDSFLHTSEYGAEQYKRLLENWEAWEQEYARRGFVTLSLEEFSDFEGIEDKLGQKRVVGEHPDYHAKQYRMETGEMPNDVVKRVFGPGE